jgi:glucokinase
MPALVIDLGGTHLRCAIARNGSLLEVTRSRVENFTGGHNPGRIWASLASQIARYHCDTLRLLPSDAPIVIAFPGPIGPAGEILDAPTLIGPGATMPDVPADLQARTGRPVRILNDVAAAAWYLSTKTTARRFLAVTVSSGIGSKMFDRGHPGGVIDDPAYAGEIGHVVVDDRDDAAPCGCGGRGHLGVISSGRGTERQARETAARDPRSFARSACATRFGASPATLSNEEHLAPAVRAGDPWALAVVRSAAAPLARVLVTLITGAGLEKVFLIGGFAESMGPAHVEIIRDLAEQFCRYPVLQGRIRETIESAEAHDEACLRGAALFAARMAGSG